MLGADVRGHDNDVAEVDPPALAIGELAVFEHLQQEVKRIARFSISSNSTTE